MPPQYADPAEVEKAIADTLNANAGAWGGALADARRSDEAITFARISSGYEILRAISMNTAHPWFGNYQTLVTVTIDPATNDFVIPSHDGEMGIPLIVPYSGATPQNGIPADPDEIDSYRNDGAVLSIYSGALDNGVAHDQQDANGQASPLACYYSAVAGRFKFSGYSAELPLITITETMADTQIPIAYTPTLVKLSIPKLLKEGDRLFQIAPQYGALGQMDLKEITEGKLTVMPFPKIMPMQKQL